jgi:hypothetical protein
VYVGEWKNGERHGQGTHTSSDGQKYVGELKDDKVWNGIRYDKDGNIILKVVNGELQEIIEKPIVVVNKKEKGVLYESKVNGELGWYKSGDEKTGWKYEGEVENGKPNGQGTMTAPDGSIYEGKFKDGRQNGQGTMTLIKGGEILGKYVGEFKNDSPNGQGTTTLFSGGGIVVKYVGEHKNNRYHGQGTITYPNGRKFVGEFRKEKPWNVTGYDKNGNIIGKFVNGEWIKQ